jgi:hypothetical protein
MTAASASEPDSRRTLLEDTPKDDSLGGPPRNPDNGEIREEDGEPENGKKKKKTSKRSAGAKKRGTGFEGEQRCGQRGRDDLDMLPLQSLTHARILL